MSTRGHIDGFHMMVVGKYFDVVDDFCNAEMVNKKYRGMIDKYKYNPVPLNDERCRRLFHGVETQHLYSKDDEVWKDGCIKGHVWWYPVNYGDYRKRKGKSNKYKCVEYTRRNTTRRICNIPEGVNVLGDCCFMQRSVSSITIPSTVSVIGMECFNGCISLSSISIPSSVSVIGDQCFCMCSHLLSIIIPSSVCVIEKECFYGCRSLSSISIPSTVSVIGKECFYGCSLLSSITVPICQCD